MHIKYIFTMTECVCFFFLHYPIRAQFNLMPGNPLRCTWHALHGAHTHTRIHIIYLPRLPQTKITLPTRANTCSVHSYTLTLSMYTARTTTGNTTFPKPTGKRNHRLWLVLFNSSALGFTAAIALHTRRATVHCTYECGDGVYFCVRCITMRYAMRANKSAHIPTITTTAQATTIAADTSRRAHRIAQPAVVRLHDHHKYCVCALRVYVGSVGWSLDVWPRNNFSLV